MKEIKNNFDRIALIYDDFAFTRTRGLKYIERREKNIVLSLFNPPEPHLILDAGAGTGRWTKLILEKGCAVISVDLSRSMLLEIKKNICDHSMLVNVDVEHLPFRDESFDGVVCIRVLKYLPNPRALLSEFSRVSRKGAVIVFETLNPRNPQVYYDSLTGHGPKILFSLRILRKWLSEDALQITAAKGFLWIPFMLYERIRKSALVKFFERVENLMDNLFPPVFVRSLYYRCVKRREVGRSFNSP